MPDPPCTLCLLQYHLHTLSSTDVPTVKRRCGAVVKEAFNGACSAANERGLMMASLEGLAHTLCTRASEVGHQWPPPPPRPERLAGHEQPVASRGIVCVLAMYRRSLTLHAEEPDATVAVRS